MPKTARRIVWLWFFLSTINLLASPCFAEQPSWNLSPEAQLVRNALDENPACIDTRVMTFNIRLDIGSDGKNAWPRRKALVVKTIKSFSPDLLGLQEVLPSQAKYLAEQLPELNSVGGGRESDRRGEASPILYCRSRYDLLAAGMFWLSDTPEVPGSKTWGNQYPRVCTWARLFDRQQSITLLVVNTHWDHESQRARMAGANLIVDRLSKIIKRSDALILMGDFNAGPENPARQVLKQSHLVEAYSLAHHSKAEVGTYHAFSGKPSTDKIDAIYLNSRWLVKTAEIDQRSFEDRFPSDHFPVNAILIPKD